MAEEPAADFGTFLRQAREKRGVSLQQLSTTTKISARVLESLERNDPSKLPGGIFSRAFVRSYAREVGLDPESAVERFITAFPDLSSSDTTPTATGLDDRETFESRRRVATTVLQLLGVSLVVLVIIVIYYSLRPKAAEPIRAVPETAQEPRTPPAAPASPAMSQAQPLTAAPGPANGVTPGVADGPASPAAGPMAAQTPPAAVTDAPLSIEIAASGACWLVLTIDGARVVARTLDPGEHVRYPVRSFVTINAGNAGALSLTLNGKPAKPIGTSGQVVTATITPGNVGTFLQYP
jgi:cytoskeleton protein RodZ